MYACITPPHPILDILIMQQRVCTVHDYSGLVNNRLLFMMSYLNLLVLHIIIKNPLGIKITLINTILILNETKDEFT